MDDTTREAVRAFHRLLKATAAAANDPFNPGSEETLTNAAVEANAAMATAGLLGRPGPELFALVREEFPDYGPTA
ncbi:hypothetical protein [Streptomyces scopuliridis]|uniref:hypothetical protein n=1 Tax=Streptomyces scopuliridis TaxID=452529 RepID=UPI0035D63857